MKIGKVAWNDTALKKYFNQFMIQYDKRPLNKNNGGCKSNNMYYIWFLLKKFKHFKYIIESGTWRGQLTWMIENCCPNAKIYSIDTNLGNLYYKSEKVSYLENDFTTINWKNIKQSQTLCIFDDNQHMLSRIQFCKEQGFKYLVFIHNKPKKNIITLKELFENSEHTKYLKETIKIYYEFPPIYNYQKQINGALLKNENQKKYYWFDRDKKHHSFLCFVELK